MPIAKRCPSVVVTVNREPDEREDDAKQTESRSYTGTSSVLYFFLLSTSFTCFLRVLIATYFLCLPPLLFFFGSALVG